MTRRWAGAMVAAFGAAMAVGLCGVRAAQGQELPFDAVVQQLRSPDPQVRLVNLRLLRDAGYPEAAVPVAALLADAVPQVQFEAIQTELSLFLTTRVPSRRRVGGVIEVRSSAEAAKLFDQGLAVTSAHPVPVDVVLGLHAAMSSREPRIRTEATYALGVLARTAAAQVDQTAVQRTLAELVTRLADPDTATRVAAARVAGRLGLTWIEPLRAADITPFGDALVTALNDKSPYVRPAVADALGRLRYERAVKSLTDLLTYYGSGPNAVVMLEALARIGHRTSVPVFAAALAERRDPLLRRAAVEGLGRAGDKASLSQLRAMLESERDASLALALAFATYRLGDAASLARVIGGLQNTRTRPLAFDYLFEVGPPAAPALAAALSGSREPVRLALIELLGLIGTERELAALQPLAAEHDTPIARKAQWALASIRARH